jgi:peptide/nickel transport system permease protein
MKNREIKILGIQVDIYSQLAIFCLVLIILTGLLSNVIATSKPLYIKYKGKSYFPAFTNKKMTTGDKWVQDPNNIDWYNLYGYKIFAPVPYDAGKSDRANANYQPPFSKSKCQDNDFFVAKYKDCKFPFRHWLGTNLKGEDLLSGLIHGTSVSLKIGFFSILLALIIGTIFGLIAGFFQNDSWKVPLLSLIFMVLSIIPSFYLADLFTFFGGEYLKWKDTGLLIGSFFMYVFTVSIGCILSYWTGKLIHFIFKWKKKVYVPLDTIVSRIVEVFAAIPKLMLVVALAAILDRSITNVILVIGISSWAGIARLVRGEVLKIRNQDFITSAKALGLTNRQIIFKHILPNISGPILVTFVFGLSAAILIESGLSFLNMGVPENIITWGQLLADGKQNFNAWWLIAFPGFAIFITVLCLNVLGEKFRSLLDPTNRSFT